MTKRKMAKYIAMTIVVLGVLVLAGCGTVTYTTTMEPEAGMLVTSGDLPNQEYSTLGFVEGTAVSTNIGLPTEARISEMKSESLNQGLIRKARELGADAVISVEYTTTQNQYYLFFMQTTLNVKGTAIAFE